MLNLNLVMIEQVINVSIVSRNYAETFNVSVSVDETIGELKQRLKRRLGYEENKQVLFYDEKLLQDDQTMMDYGIRNKAKIFLRKKIEVTIIKNETTRRLIIEETIRLLDLMSLFVTDNYKWKLNGVDL